MTERRFVLNTGAEIPALGLGTWQSKAGEVSKAVKHAIETGYRHIDAAYCYGNEDEVGQGLKEAFASGLVRREDVFVTTKLWCTYHTKVEEGLSKSLKALGLDYVDLFLMHWPVAMNPSGNDDKFPKLDDGSRDLLRHRSHVDTWKDMEKTLTTGRTKAIGVANYSVQYLKELLPNARVVPAVNQIENHPLLPQQDIVDFCDWRGIHVTAYSPLGSSGSPLINLPVIKEVAARQGTSPAVVLLSWHERSTPGNHLDSCAKLTRTIVSNRRSVLAKSVTPSRIEENSGLVHLSKEDLVGIELAIRQLGKSGGFHRYVYPAFGIDLGFPDRS